MYVAIGAGVTKFSQSLEILVLIVIVSTHKSYRLFPFTSLSLSCLFTSKSFMLSKTHVDIYICILYIQWTPLLVCPKVFSHRSKDGKFVRFDFQYFDFFFLLFISCFISMPSFIICIYIYVLSFFLNLTHLCHLMSSKTRLSMIKSGERNNDNVIRKSKTLVLFTQHQ